MPVLLAVTAHPDDESFIFGGALAMAARRGEKAGLLCLTDGQAGRDGGLCPRERLGEVRRGELRRAAGLLGIPHLFTPGLMDGALDRIPDADGARIVRKHADDFGAEVLLTFGPEGASGHADHKAAHRWTLLAAGGRPVYCFAQIPGLEPKQRGGRGLDRTTVIDVGPVEPLKRLAFDAHRTQRDHKALHDEIMEMLKGAEIYHRALPPFPPGSPIETSFRVPTSGGDPGSSGR